jgi:hypothetical protein
LFGQPLAEGFQVGIGQDRFVLHRE